MPNCQSLLGAAHVRQGGFILIAVLGMTILLTLIASFVATYAEQRLQQTLELRNRWQQQLDQQATLATLKYFLATNDPVNGGWPLSSEQILRADGRRYTGNSTTVFALQDEGPLLSLLTPDRERWQRLLYQHGLSASQTEQFLDQLQDYTDQDDLRRLNGASSLDYKQADLAPPPQRFMRSPGQVFNLLNAKNWQPLLYDILPMVTTYAGQVTNLNTTPQAVLATLPGADDVLWQSLVEQRELHPLKDLRDANQKLGQVIPVNDIFIPTVPSEYVRLQIWRNGDRCRQVTWIGLTLTPSAIRAPWEIDYVFDYSHSQPCQSPVALDAAALAG